MCDQANCIKLLCLIAHMRLSTEVRDLKAPLAVCHGDYVQSQLGRAQISKANSRRTGANQMPVKPTDEARCCSGRSPAESDGKTTEEHRGREDPLLDARRELSHLGSDFPPSVAQ